MKKLMAVLLLGFAVVSTSYAGVAKSYYTHRYATTISTVAVGDAALYGVIMSTAASSGDYINFFDSSNVNGLATTYITSAPFVMRLMYSTSTLNGTTIPQNTVYKFDPPIQFDKGIMITPSAAAESITIIYESGRP
jgi:hypothetical protein